MKKVLFITLSNIGDVILSLPALDYLINSFCDVQMTVIAGPRSREIFQDNPKINNLIIYDKHAAFREKVKLFNRLQKDKFDVIVDLRNSFFGAFLRAKYKTSPFMAVPGNIKHMKERHLYKVKNLSCRLSPDPSSENKKRCLYTRQEDEKYINLLLKESGISRDDKIAIISPGARSHIKRWSADKFAQLSIFLADKIGLKVILVGDKDDKGVAHYISDKSVGFILDFTGRTSLIQLAVLLKKAECVITNDSAILHLAGYLDIPTVGIFGPTNELKYGPWSFKQAIVKKDIFCRPCEKAQCRFMNLACLQLVKIEDVLRGIRRVLSIREADLISSYPPQDFRRILIVRTDRIGDVILSTPVINALRQSYPHAYIAMMVSPVAREIVEGNPHLDEVIIYDKENKHKSWRRSFKFSQNLKKKKFDLAIILHPTNRVHLLSFLAGISRRIGYDRKLGFLLTDRVKHTKQRGEKHELEYNLDLIRYLGIELAGREPFMPIRQESEQWAERLFRERGIDKSSKIIAIHPGASCPSKIWPGDRFAAVADNLVDKYAAQVLFVSGPKDTVLVDKVISHMRRRAINLAGNSSLSQLASLLKRCDLFISNDSGPVHIASALGVPVISIFGRKQDGLSPKRWGPLGLKDRFLHKETGCLECLAHNCVKDFACLKAITVDDVLKVADEIIR